MSIEGVPTYCVSKMLHFMSEIDVWKFGEALPFHQEAVNSHWKCLRYLDIDKIDSKEHDTLIRIIKKCENLKEIKFLDELEISDSEIFQNLPGLISKYCQKIEVVNIPGILLTNKQILALSKCTTIKSLSILFEASESYLEILFSNNNFIEEVSLNDNYRHLSGECLRKLPNTLTKLDLIKCRNINNEVLLDCIENWNLKTLSLSYRFDEYSFFTHLIPKMKNVLNLSISVRNNIPYHLFKQLKKIKTFSLRSGNYAITNEVLKIIVESFTDLEGLILNGMKQVNEDGFKYIGDLKKLVKLSILSGCEFSEEHIHILAKCQTLKELKVIRCETFNDNAGILVIQEFQNLTYFEVKNCSITDELINNTIVELNNQLHRKEVLNMKLQDYSLSEEVSQENRLHPLLKLTTKFTEILDIESESDVDSDSDSENEGYSETDSTTDSEFESAFQDFEYNQI